ncbi:MAG: stage II sporulation protein P [Clostridium sp.]
MGQRSRQRIRKKAAQTLLPIAAVLCLILAGSFLAAGLSPQAAVFLWQQWYPQKTEADSERRLLEFILNQVPYYRTIKEQRNLKQMTEVDPAYKVYRENQRLINEYECLVGEGSKDKVREQPAGNQIFHGAGLTVTGTQYIEAQLADYDFLMKHFYTVHPTTTAGRDVMKAETFLAEDFSLKGDPRQPQILIYHTHSQEEFADYGTGNREATIMGVGTYLTGLLEQKGYCVIHDTSVYDLRDGKLDRSKAYTYALEGITEILTKYPSIEVVLDIHRDGVKAGTHLVQTINGKQTAPIMFFNGTSQTPSGPIESLKNPYKADNMAFSFQMKLCAEAYFPGFTRKIYLKGLRYNMHLRPRSALIEVGAQTSTYQEARNAMEPLSELLDMVLKPK